MQSVLNTAIQSYQAQQRTNFNASVATSALSMFAGGNTFNPQRAMGQISDMLGGFSKAAFSTISQHSQDGQSRTVATTISAISRSCAPAPRPDSRDCRGGDRTPPRNDCGCDGRDTRTSGSQWSNTEVSNNKASIDLGDYKLNFNKADSSMTVTNKQSGDTTKIWGDPHIDQHAGSGNKASAMFNGSMTFKLPDDTKITVGTQAAKNNPKVSYADDVTITRGNQAYVVKGLSEKDSAGLTVQKSRDGRQLDASTPDGYTVVAARDGKGWIDPTTGKQPTQSDFNRATA